MSAITASIGITSIASGLTTKVSTSRKTEVKVIRDYAGNFGVAQAFDPVEEFSVSGKGSYPSITLGIATSNLPSTITGGVSIIEKWSQTEKNDDFPDWEYSGKHYPGAS